MFHVAHCIEANSQSVNCFTDDGNKNDSDSDSFYGFGSDKYAIWVLECNPFG